MADQWTDADVREPIAARLRRIAEDTSFPAWLRAEATVAAHDVANGCDIPTATDDLTVGAWLCARVEQRHDSAGQADDPDKPASWAASQRSTMHNPQAGPPTVLKFRSKSGRTEVARRGDGTISIRVLTGQDRLDRDDANRLAAALAPDAERIEGVARG